MYTLQELAHLKNDIKLYSWDLQEYKNSIQGKKINKLLNKDISYSNDKYRQQLVDALNDYWYCRNYTKFTYSSKQDRIDGEAWDKEIAQMYREQN